MTRRVRAGGRVAMWTVALLALALAVLSGCGGPPASGDPASVQDPGSQDPGTPATPAPSLTVAFADAAPADHFTPSTTARIDDTAAVFLVADWNEIAADRSAHVVIRAPDGTAYFDQVLPLADGTTGLVSVTSVASAGTRRLVVKLLVWGTVIEQYRWTGPWQAAVSLQGDDLSGAAQLDLQ